MIVIKRIKKNFFINYLFFSKCDAFNEIPLEIIRGENEHTKPLEGQDNNIVFEPIEE